MGRSLGPFHISGHLKESEPLRRRRGLASGCCCNWSGNGLANGRCILPVRIPGNISTKRLPFCALSVCALTNVARADLKGTISS
jgi:hypothetical protein